MAQYAATTDSMFAGYLDPEEAKDYFEQVEKTSILQQVAQKIPMGATGIKIPHWTGDVTAAWVAEGGKKPITKGNLEKQVVSPHKIASIFVASAETVRANPANYLGTMRTKVATAIAMAFDSAGLHGTNSPFGAFLDQSTKVRGLRPNPYDTLAVNGLSDLVYDGKKWGATLLDDTVEPILNGAKDDNGRPLFVESTYEELVTPFRSGRIVGRPTILSDHVANGSVVGYQGDFSQILWGQVGGLSFDVSDQASLDLSLAQDGSGIVSLWQNNLVAVRVEAEYGLLVNDPQAFVKLTGGLDVHTFTLNLNGATGGSAVVSLNNLGPSAPIAFNAASSAVKSAIVGIDDAVLADKVTVTGSAGVYTVTVPGVLTANGASLTGGSPLATASVTLV